MAESTFTAPTVAGCVNMGKCGTRSSTPLMRSKRSCSTRPAPRSRPTRMPMPNCLNLVSRCMGAHSKSSGVGSTNPYRDVVDLATLTTWPVKRS